MSTVTDCAFELKADLFPLTVFHLHSTNPVLLKERLAETIQKAPNYFNQAPLVIDATRVSDEPIDLAAIANILRESNILPLGVRGLSEKQKEQASAANLAIFKQGAAPIKEQRKEANKAPKKPRGSSTRIITKPVRAGTKIYAKDADLVIIAPVNVGAECIADGNIHVYGPLRGRALAGASGDTSARIFCQSLDAELIAIAGHYQVSEHLQVPEHNDRVLQIFLQDNTLKITTL